ncbi:RNA-directed DNA polymerase, eukaryota, reverse transcriptase zinc-binding domain protein [Tanacetum coccineum]
MSSITKPKHPCGVFTRTQTHPVGVKPEPDAPLGGGRGGEWRGAVMVVWVAVMRWRGWSRGGGGDRVDPVERRLFGARRKTHRKTFSAVVGGGGRRRRWWPDFMREGRERWHGRSAHRFKNAVSSGLIQGASIEESDMNNIVHVLNVFYLASGLKINVSKSNVYGLGVDQQDIEAMARDIGCGSDRFRAKLSSWKASTLSIGGRLTLIKSALGSLGIYYMSIFKCPESVLNSLEALRALFFWGGSEEKRKMSWLTWENVMASFDKAHAIKAVHGVDAGVDLMGCNCNGVWASIISVYSMLHDRNILINTLSRKVGNGSSIRFWKDTWNGNVTLMTKFNRLYHLDANDDCFLSDRRVNNSWVWDWKRQVLDSRNEATLEDLVSELGQVQLLDKPDAWTWILDNDDVFTVHATRVHLDSCLLPSCSPSTRWSKTLPRKVNIFVWRLSLDRLPTRLNLSLRGLDIPSIMCPMCNNAVESVDHVFFGCDLSSNVWCLVRRWTNIDMPSFSSWFDCL